MSRKYRTPIRARETIKDTVCPVCEKSFRPSIVGQIYCGRKCSRTYANRKTGEAKRQAYLTNPRICPCGKAITYERRHLAHYCDQTCINLYANKKTKNPENYVTLICMNEACGKEFKRYTKLYKKGQSTFCSNKCAAKHTKTIRHYVVRDMDMVLDSSWEMLFAGLCFFLKIPLERTDRGEAIEWTEGHYYAPDFYLPDPKVWVEIKGYPDIDDDAKWAAWINQRGALAILYKPELMELKALNTVDEFVAKLLAY